jgi:hypothetical protein
MLADRFVQEGVGRVVPRDDSRQDRLREFDVGPGLRVPRRLTARAAALHPVGMSSADRFRKLDSWPRSPCERSTSQSLPETDGVLCPPGTHLFRGPFFALLWSPSLGLEREAPRRPPLRFDEPPANAFAYSGEAFYASNGGTVCPSGVARQWGKCRPAASGQWGERVVGLGLLGNC